MRKTIVLFLGLVCISLGIFFYLFQDIHENEDRSLASLKDIKFEHAKTWARGPATFLKEKKEEYDKYSLAYAKRKQQQEEVSETNSIINFAKENLDKQVPGEASWFLVKNLLAFDKFDKKNKFDLDEDTIYRSRSYIFKRIENNEEKPERAKLVIFNPNRLSFAVLNNQLLLEFSEMQVLDSVIQKYNLDTIQSYNDIKWAIVKPKNEEDVFALLADLMKEHGVLTAQFEKAYIHEKHIQ